MSRETNTTRLETAFYVAEVELGVTRLLDPEDVDVENPDEKSVMTYVAQFLHRYPEGSQRKVRSQEEFLYCLFPSSTALKPSSSITYDSLTTACK